MENGIIKKTIQFINMLTTRSAMYQIQKVEDVSLVIFGFIYGLSDKESEIVNDFMNNFRVYSNSHFEMNGEHDWTRLIRFHSANDKHSIELFASLFNQFVNKK